MTHHTQILEGLRQNGLAATVVDQAKQSPRGIQPAALGALPVVGAELIDAVAGLEEATMLPENKVLATPELTV